MRIERFSYTDKMTGWNLKPFIFDRLTLLVGAFGVGKTRILKSILNVKKIARGHALNGIKWNVEFITTKTTSIAGKESSKIKGFHPISLRL